MLRVSFDDWLSLIKKNLRGIRITLDHYCGKGFKNVYLDEISKNENPIRPMVPNSNFLDFLGSSNVARVDL